MESWREELYHHGVKGQKWGDRNYQYEDGSLTPEGKVHYGVGENEKKSGFKQGVKTGFKTFGKAVAVGAVVGTKSAKKGASNANSWADKQFANKVLKKDSVPEQAADNSRGPKKYVKRGFKTFGKTVAVGAVSAAGGIKVGSQKFKEKVSSGKDFVNNKASNGKSRIDDAFNEEVLNRG